MFNSAAYLSMPWAYLANVIVAVTLGALLFAGRASLRRSTRLVAVIAVIALAAGAVLIAFAYHVPASLTESGYVATIITYGVAEQLAVVLTYAAWGLLLYAAVQASRWGWLIVMVVVMAITLTVPLALVVSALTQLRQSLFQANEGVALALLIVFEQIGTIAALVFAFLLPAGSAAPTPPAPPTGE